MDVVKSHYGTLGLYFLLAIVLTYPLCFSLTDALIGHEQATAGCHVWVLWWAQTDMTAIKTPLIFFPYGGDVVQLYGSDLLSPLLLSWFPISPVLLYNVWILLLFICGAMGLRQLALHLGASYEGAFVGGVVFVSGPFFLHELLNGTSELLAAFFLPWFLLFLIRTYEKESYRNAIALGFFASLCLLSSVYNAFFVLLISIVWLLYQSMKTMEPIWTRGFLSRTAISLVVFSPALFLVAWLQLNHGATQTASRRETLLSQGAILPDSYASIEDWFNPTEADLPVIQTLYDGTVFEYWTVCTVYVGWLSLILAAVGIWKTRKERLGLYVWLGGIAALLAMGPYLRMEGELVSMGGGPISLPLRSLVYIFPPLAIVAIHAYRFTALLMMSTAIFVAKGVRNPLWSLVILLEVLLISPVPYPIPQTDAARSTALEALREAPDGAVLVAPLERDLLFDLSQAFIAQVQHQKPIQDGGIRRRAGEETTALLRSNELLASMAALEEPILIYKQDAYESSKELCALGYRYFLLRKEDAEIQSWAASWLGEPGAEDTKWIWWPLPDC